MKTHLSRILLAALLVGTPGALRADVTNTVSIWEGGGNPVFTNPAPYTVPDIYTYAGGTIPSFSSYAGQGFSEVSFQLEVTNDSGDSYANVSTTPAWTDTLTINAPGMTGQQGTFTFRLILNAVATVSNPFVLPVGHPTLNLSYNANGAGVSSSQFWGVSINPTIYSNHVIEYTAPFVFGSPFNLSAGLNVAARETGGSLPEGEVATFSANASLAWNGIPAVFDVNSVPVTNFTTTSGSGTDYAEAVPEPGSTLLLALGSLALLHRRRRSASARR